MKLEIKEEKKNKIVFELKGENHTMCNALKKELWQDPNIKIAGYDVTHPLIDEIKFIVETNGKESPKKALNEAVKRLKKQGENFKSAFAKAAK